MEQLSSNVKENDKRNYSIKKYNLDGELMWEQSIKGLSTGNGIVSLGLIIKKNKEIKLELRGVNARFTWDLSAEGDVLNAKVSNKKLLDLERIKGNYIPVDDTPAYEFFKNCKNDDHKYHSHSISEDKGILIDHNNDTEEIDIYLFSK